jgi:hypothetical protein
MKVVEYSTEAMNGRKSYCSTKLVILYFSFQFDSVTTIVFTLLMKHNKNLIIIHSAKWMVALSARKRTVPYLLDTDPYIHIFVEIIYIGRCFLTHLSLIN